MCFNDDNINIKDGLCCTAGDGCKSSPLFANFSDHDDNNNTQTPLLLSIRCDASYSCDGINGLTLLGTDTNTNAGYYQNDYDYEILIDIGGLKAGSDSTINGGTVLNNSNIVVTGFSGCADSTIANFNNVYAFASESLMSFTGMNISNIYGYGMDSLYLSIISNINNVYCGNDACRGINITNIGNNIYAIGYSAIEDSVLKNIENNVIAIGHSSIKDILIDNGLNLLCDGYHACENNIIVNVSNIEVNGTNVLSGTDIYSSKQNSGMVGYGVKMNVIFNDGVKIDGDDNKALIICQINDVCKFYCNSTSTCNTFNAICNGTCLYDDHDLFNTTAPTAIPTTLPTIATTMKTTRIVGNQTTYPTTSIDDMNGKYLAAHTIVMCFLVIWFVSFYFAISFVCFLMCLW